MRYEISLLHQQTPQWMQKVCVPKMKRRICNTHAKWRKSKKRAECIRFFEMWMGSLCWHSNARETQRCSIHIFILNDRWAFKWLKEIEKAKSRANEPEKSIIFFAVISRQKSHIYSSYTSYFNTLVLSFFACASTNLRWELYTHVEARACVFCRSSFSLQGEKKLWALPRCMDAFYYHIHIHAYACVHSFNRSHSNMQWTKEWDTLWLIRQCKWMSSKCGEYCQKKIRSCSIQVSRLLTLALNINKQIPCTHTQALTHQQSSFIEPCEPIFANETPVNLCIGENNT